MSNTEGTVLCWFPNSLNRANFEAWFISFCTRNRKNDLYRKVVNLIYSASLFDSSLYLLLLVLNSFTFITYYGSPKCTHKNLSWKRLVIDSIFECSLKLKASLANMQWNFWILQVKLEQNIINWRMPLTLTARYKKMKTVSMSDKRRHLETFYSSYLFQSVYTILIENHADITVCNVTELV